MAVKVKPIDTSVTKWSENAGRAAEQYAVQAEAAAETWAKNTAGAADNYHSAVSMTQVKERFRRGVNRAGASKYARKIRDVAKDRYAPGIAAAGEDYKSGVTPYLDTIAALTLSPRKPKGDPANYKRVEEIGKALNAKRLALLGSTAS